MNFTSYKKLYISYGHQMQTFHTDTKFYTNLNGINTQEIWVLNKIKRTIKKTIIQVATKNISQLLRGANNMHTVSHKCIPIKHSSTHINNCPTRCNTKQSIYYSASSLYMFRLPNTPIIRSTQINRLSCVASRWTITNIDQRCTEPWT